MKKGVVPSGLTVEEYRVLLSKEYGITDSGGKAIMEAGLSAYGRAEQAKKQIDNDGLMIPCAKGGFQKHPLLSTERDNRALWLAALRQLNFDVIPLNPGPGRPTR
jgi:hypothetical protein